MKSLENSAASAAEFVTISELAKRLGVTIGPVSRRVARLEASGLLSARVEGARKLVDFAAFQAAVARVEDAPRAANGRLARGGSGAASAPADGPSLLSEQTRKAKAQADLAEMQVAKLRGELVEVAEIALAMEKAGGRLARGVDGIVSKADEWAAIVGREGSAGLRMALKAYARELRERLAADMTAGGGADEE